MQFKSMSMKADARTQIFASIALDFGGVSESLLCSSVNMRSRPQNSLQVTVDGH